MSKENPLASSSTTVQQSRSQDSLNLQQGRGLAPIGEEVKIRAHRNLSSHNLCYRSPTVGTTQQTPFARNDFAVPQPVALQLPPARIMRPPRNNVVRYQMNHGPVYYNPAMIPAYNAHLNNMRLVSKLYFNFSTQDMEAAMNNSQNPLLQVNNANGIVSNMMSQSVMAQRVQSISTNSNQRHLNISMSSTTTHIIQSQGINPPPTFPHSPQLLNSPPTFHQGPQSFNAGSIEISSPQFNAMQHPLLARNLSLDSQMASLSMNQASPSTNMPTQQEAAQAGVPKSPAHKGNNKSPKKKKAKNRDKSKQREMDDENKYFEPYITAAAVAIGIKNKTIVQGVIRINPNQFQHSYVSNEDSAEQDIHIDGVKNRNRALEGDVVAVELLPEPSDKKSVNKVELIPPPAGKELVNKDPKSKEPVNKKTVNEVSDNKELVNVVSDNKEPAHEVSDNNEPFNEVSDNNEPVNEVSDNNELVNEVSDNIEPVNEVLDNIEPVNEVSDNNEPVNEASDSKEPVNEVSENKELVKDPVNKDPDNIVQLNKDLDNNVPLNKDSDSNESISEEPLNASESKQRRGRVVRIIEKSHSRKCIGTLRLMPDKNRQRALLIPRDHRIPRLNIPFTNWPNNFYECAKQYENTLFLAQIVDWYDVRFALGQISCFLGQAGDMLTETMAILAQNDLDVTPYGREVRHLFPRLDFVIPEDEINIREDCRKLCTFSIDPFTCRDIDDALSCRPLENGNYEIGVHISDVSYFLKEDTSLDAQVANRATTIYMVERAYHMLPDELCMLCSLFPAVDKLAFSVFWEITEDAQVLKHRFCRTVIHSCAQLAYEHAQAVLEGKENAESQFPEIHNGFKYEDVYKSIKILGKISSIFREQRFAGGALRIDQPKVAFNLSPQDGMPESYWIYESKESHQLIEEFMLLANMTVAKQIYKSYPKLAFLRAHPPPNRFMMKQLHKALLPIGISLDIRSAGSIHRSLIETIGKNNLDKGKAMVLNLLCAKPMSRANYICSFGLKKEDFLHYALNVPMYTHFTSPIRRYADIMVHRLLAASLNYREKPKWDAFMVKRVADQCNKQKYNAKKAGEMSTELYILKYISTHAPLVTEAVVVEVKDKYIDVIIVKMGLNRRLFFNVDFPGTFKCLKKDGNSKQWQMEVTWKATDNKPEVKQIIEMFQIIKVEMHNAEDVNKVDTKLARPTNVDPV